jgi:uncharacterized protein (TIGR02421 family)
MPGSIGKTLLTEIINTVERNKQVRRNLPDGSRLHIEHQVPFLAVYRRPLDRHDAGTERLLLGEAAYLLATSTERHFTPLQHLVQRCAEIQHQRFGGFLLFELWSGSAPEQDTPPTFRIIAPNQSPPTTTLEALENALLGVSIAGKQAKVEVVYRKRIHPPGLKPLYHATDQNITPLGIELSPIYQSADGSELFPFELKELHHALTQVFKRTFYTFIHAHTTQRPKHFQELGRKRITQAVRECDRQLAGISQSFDLLLHVTPVNATHAWERFRHSGYRRTPEFLYRQRPIDPSLMKRRLFSIPLEKIEDPTLTAIFNAKQDELDRQISLVADRNTKRFLLGSRQIYGDVDEKLLALANTLLQNIPPHTHDDHKSDVLEAEAFAELARAELAHYREHDSTLAAKVEVRQDITGILVSKGDFLIGTDVRIARARVEATLAHEIGIHTLTYHNGRQQPLHELYCGMAGYEPLQEGIAVLAEYLVGGLSRPRLRLLAGRVLAVKHITDGADFLETYRSLHDKGQFSRHTAFTIAMRVYRGGGYTKDAVYLRGLSTLLHYLAEGGDIETLLVGKITLEQLPFIEELCHRQVLHPPRLTPRFLHSKSAQQRLARLRQSASMIDLLEAVP